MALTLADMRQAVIASAQRSGRTVPTSIVIIVPQADFDHGVTAGVVDANGDGTFVVNAKTYTVKAYVLLGYDKGICIAVPG